MPVYFETQAQVGALLFNKALTEVSAKYSNYSSVFLAENTAKLPENTGMNEYAIKLEEGKQPSFGPIYNLGLVELETLKTYIETNLANGFIWLSKSPTGASILFNWKLNGSLRLYVDYWSLNSITIKNRYLLLLISESLDQLGRTKWFTQLDLTNAYHRMKICEDDNGKLLSGPNMATLNTRLCFLAYPMLQPSSKDTLTRFWLKSWISLLLYIWMTY